LTLWSIEKSNKRLNYLVFQLTYLIILKKFLNSCNILDIKKGYEEFLKEKNIQEIVILQKCNCTEICVWGDYDLEDTIKRWKKVASNSSGFDM